MKCYRRTLVGPLAILSSVAGVLACGDARTVAAPSAVSVAIPGGEVRGRALQVGTVAVKRCHQHLCGSEEQPFLDRVLAILETDDFQRPLPNFAYLVEHPEGTFLVDTGELLRFNDDTDYYACDPAAGDLDHNLLRIALASEEQLDQQLAKLGVAPGNVAGVVLTHLHADHVGGVPLLGGVPVYSSRIDVTLGPTAGGRVCRSLASADLRFVEDLYVASDDDAGAAFGRSHALTRDGALRIVPTNGHTPGALSLLVQGASVDVLFVGDAAFSDAMISSRDVAGIDADLAEKRRSYERIEAYARRRPTVVLPAHDDRSPQRLVSLERFVPSP